MNKSVLNKLHAYIAVMQGYAEEPGIESCSTIDKSYTDQGVLVDSKESVFHFLNGVVIKYSAEFDRIEEGEELCPECWLSYEVLAQPGEIEITPRKKTFTNRCQEVFWVKVNRG